MRYQNIFTNENLLLIIFPIIAFIIALIPTLKFQQPLSWDIYYHVHLAKLYLDQWFTLGDHLTYAPFGRPIFYPPFFHYILAIFSQILKMDPFQVSRFLQPVFSFSFVFSFIFVTKKLYNLRVALISGGFLFFTNVFHRSMLPIPETLALIFFPLSIYFLFIAFEGKGLKYAFISGIISGVMFLTHALTALLLLGVVLIFTFSLKLRNDNVEFKSLWVFLGVTFLCASLWWGPLIFQNGYVFNNPVTAFFGLTWYIKTIFKVWGVPGTVFAFLWAVVSIKNGMEKKSIGKIFKELSRNDLLLVIWLTFILIITSAYLIGIPILIDRIFNFAVFPVVIMASFGLEYVRSINSEKSIYYNNLYRILVVVLIFGGVSQGFLYAHSVEPLVNNSQIDVAQWFAENGDKKRVVMSLSEGIDPVIVSVSRQPVSTGGYHPGMVKVLNREMYYSGNYTREDLIRDNIGYLVETSDMVNPNYFKLVYQNKDYKVWRVEI
jgi:4-amino-4-deoxy-L-arabinose transferase-like glycosyltransferase